MVVISGVISMVPILIAHIEEVIRLMDKILHDPKDPKLWEL